MIRYTLVSVVLYLTGQAISVFSPGSIFGILKDLGALALIVSFLYYGWKFLRWLKRKALWKARNKIIVSFAFVGILPVAILLLFGWFSMTLIFGQLTAFYLENELRSISSTLERIHHRMLLSYYEQRGPQAESLSLLINQGAREIETLPSGLSRAFQLLYAASAPHPPESAPHFTLAGVYPADTKTQSAALQQAPDWLEDEYDGLVLLGNELYFTHAARIDGRQGGFLLILMLPFDQELIDYIKRRTSIDIGMIPFTPSSSPSDFQTAHSEFLSSQSFPAINWVHFFSPVDWHSGEPPAERARAILLAIPPQTLLSNIFAQSSPQAGQFIPWILLGLAVTFLVVELISLVIGATIARSITGAIHQLYAGAQNIRQGDFHYRIPAGNRDQLDALAQSFNLMSESIARLLKEVSEKERLEREIEIAKEVQTLLFPTQTPLIHHLQIAATCIPAQQVSGDYYDFIPFDRDHLDLVLGDISGKGISAALMMASLQSTLRSELLRLDTEMPNSQRRLANAVSRVSRQLYRQTPSSAYSTLVVAHFDAVQGALTYCNAGHHPPLLISDGTISRLQEGGTVVGLIESWEYGQETVAVGAGDLILIFSDGVVEAENQKGEQFGEERLIKLGIENQFLTAEDIQRLLLDEIHLWRGAGEQADDITVMVLKFN